MERNDNPSDRTGPDMVSVADAAQALGVQPAAVRKRLQRGTLDGLKVDGAWFVYRRALPRWSGPDDPVERAGHGAGQTAPVSGSALAQLEAIRSEWLQPLVDQIADLSRENGALQQENRQLREALAEQATEPPQTAPPEAPGHAESTPPVSNDLQSSGAAPRGWWHRLARYFRGD